jgi:hypothetical protein
MATICSCPLRAKARDVSYTRRQPQAKETMQDQFDLKKKNELHFSTLANVIFTNPYL